MIEWLPPMSFGGHPHVIEQPVRLQTVKEIHHLLDGAYSTEPTRRTLENIWTDVAIMDITIEKENGKTTHKR